jgi:predicted Fe-Mo cluster-binding NifX family protein
VGGAAPGQAVVVEAGAPVETSVVDVAPGEAVPLANRKENQMRLAVTAAGPDLSSALDPRFGRARYLLFVDTPFRTFEVVENSAGRDAAQGAGIQAAQTVIDHKAQVLLTGNCGPKAFRALQAAGIRVYLAPEGTVTEAVDRFDRGQLSPLTSANVDGHW